MYESSGFLDVLGRLLFVLIDEIVLLLLGQFVFRLDGRKSKTHVTV